MVNYTFKKYKYIVIKIKPNCNIIFYYQNTI